MTDEELEVMAQEVKSDAEIILPMYKDKCFILQQENKVLRKALELACEEHKIFGYCSFSGRCDKTVLTCEECIREDFIYQAQEELEKE